MSRLFRLSVFLAIGTPLLVALPEKDALESAQQAALEWVKLRAETVRVEEDWVTERQLLESSLAALKDRAEKADEKRVARSAATAKHRSEIEALENRGREARTSLAAVEDRLKSIVSQLFVLRPKLPPRLSEALELSFKSLSEPLPLAERMQLTVAVLSRCHQFSRTISVCEEKVQAEPGSAPRSLEVIYWGCSHAYALDRGARKVWYGAPGETSWKWEPLSDSADEVMRLIAIQAGKADPEFIPVPIRLPRPSH